MGGSTCQIPDYMPVGFRFRPTDEELVSHYLKHKLLGDDSDSSVVNIIPQLDLCKVEPWDIPAFSVIKSDEPEWFFFSPLGYKYDISGCKRLNRATKQGFWEVTGDYRYIKTTGTDNVIGTRKTLVFYHGHIPGFKTNWVIHEYHATFDDDAQRTFVLCRLMTRSEKKAANFHFDYENKAAAAEGITDVHGNLPKMTEEEDEFLNTFFADVNHVIRKERRHTFEKDSTHESSDTDAEVVSALEAEDEKKESTSQDDFKGVMSSSCDSTADKSLETNCIEISGSFSPRKLSSNAVSHLEIKKEDPIEEPENDHVIARNTSSRENSETRSHQSSNVNGKGSFIFWEPPSSSQSIFPGSVYLVNIFIGILVFMVISWDVLSHV